MRRRNYRGVLEYESKILTFLVSACIEAFSDDSNQRACVVGCAVPLNSTSDPETEVRDKYQFPFVLTKGNLLLRGPFYEVDV